MDTGKPEFINPAFEFSLQFWSYLVGKEVLPEPTSFINPAPHMSFVWGEGNVNFLRKRYEAMKPHHLFKDMEYSEDHEVLREWMPLVMEGRSPTQQVAATRVRYGSDVDFGAVSRYMFETIRAYGAVKMGLISDISEAAARQHTPKVAFVGKPKSYVSSSGKQINDSDIDLNVRALSMGKLHHAETR